MSDNEDDELPPPPPDSDEEGEKEDNTKSPKAANSRSRASPAQDDEGNGSGNDNDDEDGDDNEEDDGDDDVDEDEDEDDEEEEEVVKSKQKRKRDSSNKKTSKKSKRRNNTGYKLFNDEADEDDMGDEDEPDGDYEAGGEQVLDRDEQAAIDAVEKRHRERKLYQEQSAEEIAAAIDARAKQDKIRKAKYERGEGLSGPMGSMQQTVLEQQSLLPSVMDPKIFKLKCKPGNELLLVRSVMLKAIDMRNKGGLLKIKSAFCSGVKGLIYVEALSEAFAKEVIIGLRMIYGSSFSQVPVGEMTSVLATTVKKKPIKEGQWVRLKRGPLKGDLARIVGLFEGGSKAFIQAVPRPDYAAAAIAEKEGKKAASGPTKVRPQQRLFDAEEARLANSSFVFRRHHPLDMTATMYDVWENDHYKDGFLFKEVNVATYLEAADVKPRLEELQLFRQRKAGGAEDEQDEDEEALLDQYAPNAHFLKELADQIENLGDEEGKEGVNAMLPGDLVQVTSGEMRNLIARIVSVNDATRQARIVPYNNALTTEMSIEVELLVKYIFPGAHVKVVAGRYMGQTGRVVSVKSADGSNVAAILTDGINTEIQCNVGHLQMSSEVTTGYGNLMGYELYDIVALSENECAVVIVVGTEKLRVINHMGNVRDVLPMELLGKRNTFSARSTGFDIQQNVISVGDTVKVTTGMHTKLSGTVKQMMKGTLWLHSNSYLKNSGIFVVKTRNCVVAGGRAATPQLSASYKGVLQQTPVHPAAGGSVSVQGVAAVGAGAMGRGGSNSAGGRGAGRDWMVGKTVRITKGGNKGLLAQVVDATPTHYSVELLAKLKKIVVERNNTVYVGDEKGSLEKVNKAASGSGGSYGGEYMDVAQTPNFTQNTPAHYGGETPRYNMGGETPMMFGDSTPSRTPRAGGDDDTDAVWKVTAVDRERASSTSTSMQNSPGNSLYGESRRGGWDSNASVSSNFAGGTDNSAYSGSHGGYSQSSGMSSMIQSGSNTPMSMQGETGSVRSGLSVASGSTGAGAGSSEVTFREWTEDMVVLIKRGPAVGKWAVIQQRPDATSGMVHVSLRERTGDLGAGMSLHYGDLDLAQVPKKEKVIVLAGKYKDCKGYVTSIQRNDVLVELDVDPGNPQFFRMSRVAWLNTRRK